MDSVILEKLKEIEQKENVKILHCVESGSRAWGFASPDSDYDVRFIYVRPKEFYLKLEKSRDVIEWQLDETLDINGWDLQKMLRLLHNSNPTIFEWDKSPVVYYTTPEWANISKLISDCFQIKPCLYHYLSMAKSNYYTYFKKELVRYKKYFYVLRPILACRWILQNNRPAPMLFSELMTQKIDNNVRCEINKLLYMKINNCESKECCHVEVLDLYIEKSLEEIEKEISKLPKNCTPKWEPLENCFLSMLD